jgi:hypothetical protein
MLPVGVVCSFIPTLAPYSVSKKRAMLNLRGFFVGAVVAALRLRSR